MLLNGTTLLDESVLARVAGAAGEAALGRRPELGGKTGRLANGLASGVHVGQ